MLHVQLTSTNQLLLMCFSTVATCHGFGDGIRFAQMDSELLLEIACCGIQALPSMDQPAQNEHFDDDKTMGTVMFGVIFGG